MLKGMRTHLYESIAEALLDKRQVSGPLRDQAFASFVVSLYMLDLYGRIPQLEDVDLSGPGLAPVDSQGRRIGVMARKSPPFYLSESKLGNYDVWVFGRYDNGRLELFGWLPDEHIPAMPTKKFVNGGEPFVVEPGAMQAMPEAFDFSSRM